MAKKTAAAALAALRWKGTTKEQRSEAARAASNARWAKPKRKQKRKATA